MVRRDIGFLGGDVIKYTINMRKCAYSMGDCMWMGVEQSLVEMGTLSDLIELYCVL